MWIRARADSRRVTLSKRATQVREAQRLHTHPQTTRTQPAQTPGMVQVCASAVKPWGMVSALAFHGQVRGVGVAATVCVSELPMAIEAGGDHHRPPSGRTDAMKTVAMHASPLHSPVARERAGRPCARSLRIATRGSAVVYAMTFDEPTRVLAA